MEKVIIENPVINSPYLEPNEHFHFDEDGITNEIIHTRRKSSYFVPIPSSRKKSNVFNEQLNMYEDDMFESHVKEEHTFINTMREKVNKWRKGGYVGVTRTTARLLEYWNNKERDKKLFYCQLEAVETAIYIAEVAKKYDGKFIEEKLINEQRNVNSSLYRTAFKMATGTGKTVVMSMLIAWQTLNKISNPYDKRFTKSFLIVTPGITIKDRLRVLLPTDSNNYYLERDIVPTQWMSDLRKATIVVTNYHTFAMKDLSEGSRLAKIVSGQQDSGFNKETPEEMVNRVCRELGKNFIVINDEAHHCYHSKPDSKEDYFDNDEKEEAKKQNEAAKLWFNGLEIINKIVGIKYVYDLSATPFFLKGSGYPEGKLFPWVVTDFSLIDAIESGIVKVPRVPVSDNSMVGDQPTYRDLWFRISDDLPKKGRKKNDITGDPKLPKELEAALISLYGNYQQYYRDWEIDKERNLTEDPPPVFIVVCNNTTVSKLIYDYVSGWEKQLTDESTVVVPGQLPIFNNEENGNWSGKPNTILIDSEQLESGNSMSDEFKKLSYNQIEDFKAEYKKRFPGRDIRNLKDEDLLREVMNTVGKKGKLGETVKCVISVSMLTEGWDANNVTHILGVRAFRSQLLCEQVVGRALRRFNYIADENGMFEPEYAEVYGVPFSFIPTNGSIKRRKRNKNYTHIRSIPERRDSMIEYPKVVGYRYRLTENKIDAEFSEETELVLTTRDFPTTTESAPIVGKSSYHSLEDLEKRRLQEVAFKLTKITLEKYFEEEAENRKHWLFPQLLMITKKWMDSSLICKHNTFPQLLLLTDLAYRAVDKIYLSIIASEEGERILNPILKPYEYVGSTKEVDFRTSKQTYKTDQRKCHISHVVADTNSWEQKMAQVFEDMDEVRSYVKNENLGFTIPYTIGGHQRNYVPDFIVKIGNDNQQLSLIVEVSGQKMEDKQIKVSTAKNLWVKSINNYGEFGRWGFIEITDPWDNPVEQIREYLTEYHPNF
ncbi:BPTD_3080 family restriction endonuclease [Halobacillus sp. KGW1]|uniref:BPTD_3080 family restriction endonuclease n=1 Tax=Halobacillus sp. KGW1 TaxID=1793726 RepID=UPI0007816E62|nr:DEAD/DEAH box helicase family protein [Halobacillus sp. KGW1]